jgi:hypothetical protein
MIPITFPTRNGTVSSLLDGSSEISESLSALELRILNDACDGNISHEVRSTREIDCGEVKYIPASASLEKLPVH